MALLLRCKCLIVGDPTVGKSAIAQVFQTDDAHFPKAYTMTLGVDNGVKTIKADSDTAVEFHLVEVSGHEPYADFLPAMGEGVSMCLVVYDVTSESSFKAAEAWAKRVREAGVKCKAFLLVANKVDLEQRSVVDAKQGQELARSAGLTYAELSAKSGQGLGDLFAGLARDHAAAYRTKIVALQSLAV